MLNMASAKDNIDLEESNSPYNGNSLLHSQSSSSLSNTGISAVESRSVSKLRATVTQQSVDRLSPNTILQDPILAATAAAEALVPSLTIDEAMLPLMNTYHTTIADLEAENLKLLLEEEEDMKNVSTLRLKLAAAQLHDLQFELNSPATTTTMSVPEGLPPTIWSFDKFNKVDEESQLFLQDMDRTIRALQTRPISASSNLKNQQTFHNNDANNNEEEEDVIIREEFPETRSTDSLLDNRRPATTQDDNDNANTAYNHSSGGNNSELLVAKFQEMMEAATYQPDASLQWQVDNDRLQRIQLLLSQGAQAEAMLLMQEEKDAYEEDDDYDNEGDDANLNDNYPDNHLNRSRREERKHDDGHKRTSEGMKNMQSIDAAAASKMDLSRMDYESKASTTDWCRAQQQQMMLAELAMEREMAALTAALSQSAYELDALDLLTTTSSDTHHHQPPHHHHNLR